MQSGTFPANEPACVASRQSAVELRIEARPRDLGGFSVRRVLPSTERKLIGPFIFFDHMGPARMEIGAGMDVRPHPHIELATVTYLFEGEIDHKDSLGSMQTIRPGDVNWMIAGRGIVHSERSSPASRREGYVLQLQGYALAFEDSAHSKPKGFELVIVSDSGTHAVESSEIALRELRARLERSDIPWGETVTAEAFESPGAACTFCPQRPRCASYAKFAQDAWRSNVVGIGKRPLPLDVWGTVKSVGQFGTGIEVELESPDHQRRLVRGLARRHFGVALPKVGDGLWAYGLETMEGARSGRYGHPLNFHETSVTPWTSAWTTQVFVATADA